MMRLADKIALVTGGSSGIGEGIVRRFAREGAKVYLADVSADHGQKIAAGTGAVFVPLDVTQEADWSKAMARIQADHGRLDVLVNNAGVISNAAIDEIDLDLWNRVIAINLTGSMLGCRAAIELMRHNDRDHSASIINLGSTTSFLGLPNDVVYTTTKTGVVGLTRSVAVHCAKKGWNIRVNTIHPGATLTAILQGHIDRDPSMRDKFNAMSPMNRMGGVDEIAAMAVFLASDESSFSTGASFVADGGLVATHPTM